MALMTVLVRGSEECGVIEVNCWLNLLAIAFGLVKVLFPKEIGRLGGGRYVLPDRVLMVCQKCLVLVR